MDLSITNKLKDLWTVQVVDSKINDIDILLGDLPEEVSDLEDEIAGLTTRKNNTNTDIEDLNHAITAKQNSIKEFQATIAKYEKQLDSIKNSREFEALEKEKEIGGLEIMAAEKAIREIAREIEIKTETLTICLEKLDVKTKDLDFKKAELKEIEKESEGEKKSLLSERELALSKIEERLARAYVRISHNMKNGIAIAPVFKNSCGGCYANIPPQRINDIKAHYKIVDCEHCGRILVDSHITGEIEELVEVAEKKSRRKLKLTTK